MQHDECIVAIVVLLDHKSDLLLVLERQIGAVEQIIELDDLVENTLHERRHGRDALVVAKGRLIAL